MGGRSIWVFGSSKSSNAYFKNSSASSSARFKITFKCDIQKNMTVLSLRTATARLQLMGILINKTKLCSSVCVTLLWIVLYYDIIISIDNIYAFCPAQWRTGGGLARHRDYSFHVSVCSVCVCFNQSHCNGQVRNQWCRITLLRWEMLSFWERILLDVKLIYAPQCRMSHQYF